MKKQTIGVFMGAQYGHLEEFHEAAAAMGKGLSLIHISEPTRRTPISYAVFCLKKKKTNVKA